MKWHKALYAALAAAQAIAGALLVAGSTAFAAGNDTQWGPGMMYGSGGWQSMGWSMLFGGIFWLAALAIIVVAVTWLLRSSPSAEQGKRREPTGLDILEQRYARGEINREEYLGKKQDILGGKGV